MTDAQQTPSGEEVETLLRRVGLRSTRQRRAVLAVLCEADDHPTVESVHARARLSDADLSLATAYRTLAVLEEHGLVRKVTIDNEPARFEMTPSVDHEHLLDVDTGELVELRSPELDRVRLHVLERLGYEIIDHHTIIRVRRKARCAAGSGEER
jgi:Fur family ferric uptake transcriptional regulator